MNDRMPEQQHPASSSRRTMPHRGRSMLEDLDQVGQDGVNQLAAAGGMPWVAAAQDARHAPESIGHHAHFFVTRVERGSKGCSSSHDMLGMTSALRSRVAWSGDHPAGPPSTGLTFEKAQWTSSTPLGCTPRA